MSLLRQFLEAFIPLFVAIDPFGMVPVFLGVTNHLTLHRRRQVTFEAVGSAMVIAVLFMLLGDAIFRFLGITVADFKIAGGIILLVLAVIDLLITGRAAVNESEMVGIVPLAMPLIAGPALLTTILVLARRDELAYWTTTLALSANFAILLIVLLAADRIAKIVGLNTLRAFSKLVMVLLAAIAVSYIRSGILDALAAAAAVHRP